MFLIHKLFSVFEVVVNSLAVILQNFLDRSSLAEVDSVLDVMNVVEPDLKGLLF